MTNSSVADLNAQGATHLSCARFNDLVNSAFGVRKCPACTKKSELFKKLFLVAKPYWPIYLVAVILFFAGTGLSLFLPILNRNLIGPYITSLEMAGTSITMLKMDDDMIKLWDAPVKTPGLRWGA